MASKKNNVTIAIINYNGESVLAETLEGIKTQDYPDISDVRVIDNLSTDNSVPMLKEQFPEITLIEMNENRGPNPARNYALEKSDTDYVLIMDNDITMEPDALTLMIEAFRTIPEAGAVSSQIRFADDRAVIQYNGAHIHYAGEAVVNRSDSGEPVHVGALSAGCVLVDRKKALVTGRFDEEFFFGWEDGDFFYRMGMAGYPCYVQSRARVYHKKAKRGIRHLTYQVRNRWWFILKNYQTRTLIVAFPMILVYQSSVFFFLLLKGHAGDYIKGFFDLFSGLDHIRRKRRENAVARKISDRALLSGTRFTVITDVQNSALITVADKVLSSLFAGYWLLFNWMMK